MNTTPRFYASLGALMAIVALSATPSEAAGRKDRAFFVENDSSPKLAQRASENKRARRHLKNTRAMAMNETALFQPRISLELMGERVTAVRNKIEKKNDGAFSWIGHIAGSSDDLVVLTGRNGAFAGRIDYKGRGFEISRNPLGVLTISEIDPFGLPREEPLFMPEAPKQPRSARYQKTPTTATDEIRQDILVAYTDDACRAQGGDGVSNCAQIEASIVNAVADMNAAYAASQVDIEMNLVGMLLTDYDEGSKDISDMLDELRRTGDGQIDDLHTERDNYGADLVALVTGSGGGFCGIAYVGASASYAMSVTAEFCLSNRTLAHEVGHNQGSHHARSQDGGGTSGAYNYGYRRCNDGSVDDVGAPYFSTIMAYSCSGASRTGSFSNPNVNVSGVPTGIDPDDDPANGAWAARTLNESAAYIAGFRDAPATPPTTPPTTPPPATPSPPAAPDDLVAVLDGDEAIALSWDDNSDDEDQFTLQRAVGAGGFSTIATLPANTINYADNGLSQGTTYRYRVRASNSAGASSYSTVAQATTPSPPTRTTDLALRDLLQGKGVVQGSFRDTHSEGDGVQRITEGRMGQYSARNQYRANHVWEFDIFGAGAVTFSANAYVSGNEGFHFLYKRVSDKGWQPMFTVNTQDSSNVERFTFPRGTSGRVLVRATDAFQGKHETADTLTVDYMEAVSDPESDQATPTKPVVISNIAGPAIKRRIFGGRIYRPIYIERLRD